MVSPQEVLRTGDGLLLVDVQVDFCPGGALPIPDGDQVVPVLNRWLHATRSRGIPVYASRDWHPARHLSFVDQGGRWPPHCVQDTAGATFHPNLELPEDAVIVTKGVRFDLDQYSALDRTGLATQLRRDGMERLWIGGLAQDVCVLATALEALREDFQVLVLRDGTRPVTLERGVQALAKMRMAGAEIVD